MTTLSEQSEEAYVKERALYYKNKGYSVHILPETGTLPEFLANFRPDLIAQNGNENVVVEVKTRASLRNNPDEINKLEEVIKAHPGWRFELVIPAEKKEQLPDANPNLILDQAEKLNKLGINNAAYLLVWNAIEIGLRRIAKVEHIEFEKQNPSNLLQILTSLGLLEQETYNILREAMQTRNAFAHGYQPPTDKVVPLDKLVEIAKSLI